MPIKHQTSGGMTGRLGLFVEPFFLDFDLLFMIWEKSQPTTYPSEKGEAEAVDLP